MRLEAAWSSRYRAATVYCCCGRSIRNALGVTLFLFFQMGSVGAPQPVGQWDFDMPSDLLHATIGSDLLTQGEPATIPGMHPLDGAVRVGVGSHFICNHGIAPEGSSSLVNRFSILMDFRVPEIGPWYCFYQTHPGNLNDGDCFVRANDGALGVGQTGYSTARARAGVWQRLLVSVDNFAGVYRIYLNGELVLNGAPQSVDGRFSLDSTVLFCADDNGEDAPMDVSRLAVYDVSLSAADAAELGVPAVDDPANHAPQMVPGPAGPDSVATGQLADYGFAATDADQDRVQIRIDWGDDTGLSAWSILLSPGQPLVATHAYLQPGAYLVRGLARDERGKTGTWAELQLVQVTGESLVSYLTLPYLQNVRKDGIVLMWECDVAAEAEIEYGLDLAYGVRRPAIASPSGFNTFIYRCALTELLPGTTYYYRIRVGEQEGPGGAFTTAPAEPTAFSFSVWADSQGSNHGSYASDPLEPTKSMFRHMAAGGVNFGIGVGDLAENGGSYADTHQFYLDRVAALLGRSVPWFVAWGNHDGGRDTVIRRFADLPSQDRPGFSPGYGSYSFDYGGCHFICLDHASATSDILGWLETDLQSPASLNARFTFLFVHVPPYCELWIEGDAFYRSELVPLMEAYGVDVCFSGHTHEYSRGFRNGVYYCVTGGGSWLDIPEILVREWDHMTVGGYHPIPGVPQYGPNRGGGLINEYVRVDVSADSFTASMIGFQPDGTEVGVLDRFSLPLDSEPLRITRITQLSGAIELEWTGPPGPFQIQFRSSLEVGSWADLGESIEAAERSVRLPMQAAAGLYRIRLVR